MNALQEGDFEKLKALQEHRHRVTHELVTYVINPGTEVDTELVRAAAGVLRRLGQFWGRIEVETNPDFDGQEVADDEIRSGASIVVDFLLDVIDDETLESLADVERRDRYREGRRRMGKALAEAGLPY